MRLRSAISVLFISFFLSGCSPTEATFDIDSYLELSLILGSPSDRVFGYVQDVVFPYETQLANFNVDEASITSVNATYCLMYPKFRDDINLNFIREITIDAVDPNDPDNTREVFYYEQFNFNRVSEIEFFPSLPDIKDFIVDDRLQLQIEFFFNTPPPATFELSFELQFGAFEEE